MLSPILGRFRAHPLLWIAIGWISTRGLILYELGWLRGVTPWYQDVDIYRVWAHGIAQTHHLPNDPRWQYPVLAAVLFMIPNLDAQHYDSIFVVLMLLFDLATTITLCTIAHHEQRYRGVWLWLIGIAIFGPWAYLRFDLVPTLAVVAALAISWRSERNGWSASVIALGFAAKVWPVLALLGARSRRALSVQLRYFVLTVAVVFGAGQLVWGDPFRFISNQAGRGLEFESVAGMPWYLRSLITGTPVRHYFGSGSFNISGPVANSVASGFRVLMFVLAGCVVMWWWRQTRGGRTIAAQLGRDALFAALLWYLVLSPVLSVQYMIWVVGVGAVIATSRETVMKRPLILSMAALVLTRLVITQWLDLYMNGRDAALRLLLRNLVLLVAAVDALITLASPTLTARVNSWLTPGNQRQPGQSPSHAGSEAGDQEAVASAPRVGRRS
jgi:hypothetical protein